MEEWVRQALRCPACQGELIDRPGQLVCPACRLAYPVRDGIPALLAGRAVEWEATE
ncbi:MAG: Trm112 family protein [Bifidobacteriaceae bacterium]|nr:Trm112 family protein [Bifidobacteriaceae bacterium]